MNRLLILLAFISSAGFAQSRFELAPDASQIEWKGTYVLGGSHEGTLRPVSGSVLVSPEGGITKGEFTIDMNSIKSTDQQNADAKDLDDHLKSEDFFSTARFPLAFFSITGITATPDPGKTGQYSIVGLLSIKGMTNQITFPASIITNDKITTVKADIIVNRTKWDIVYRSASFFETLKDGVISDNFEVSIDLTLLKK
jgi:polyisoprenoid-binding protein YceI